MRAFRGMKNLRYKIERKLDRYNHLMELIRTATGLTVLILQIILMLHLTSCTTSKNSLQNESYTNGYDYPIEDVKLSPEFIKELQLNLIKTGVIIKDTINE